jgi:hypothetical protein
VIKLTKAELTIGKKRGRTRTYLISPTQSSPSPPLLTHGTPCILLPTRTPSPPFSTPTSLPSIVNSTGAREFSLIRRVMLEVEGRRSGRKERDRGEIGVRRIVEVREGWRMGPPEERE